MDEKQRAEKQMEEYGATDEMVAVHMQAAVDHIKVQELRRMRRDILGTTDLDKISELEKQFEAKLADLMVPGVHQQPHRSSDPSDKRGPKEAIYDERIGPLMDQIISTCEQHGIPLIAHFELDGDTACTTNMGPFRGMGGRLAEGALMGGPRGVLSALMSDGR